MQEDVMQITQKELNKIIEDDPYLIDRKNPTEAEIRLYLREVDFRCALCSKDLQRSDQEKPDQKKFQIAHIYPNRPTIKQYNTLLNVERLGDNSECFENKIALCLECHSTQDFRTTRAEYEQLLDIKKKCLQNTAVREITENLSIRSEIEDIIGKLSEISESDITKLNYEPVSVVRKFNGNEALLKNSIEGYIRTYYPLIRDEIRQIEGKNGFLFDVLASHIKICFLEVNNEVDDKEEIFNHIVKWIKLKAKTNKTKACEAIVAYFVQNCEVFYEITE